eukprot:809502-Pyramimonas_sp.AAC.2
MPELGVEGSRDKPLGREPGNLAPGRPRRIFVEGKGQVSNPRRHGESVESDVNQVGAKPYESNTTRVL